MHFNASCCGSVVGNLSKKLPESDKKLFFSTSWQKIAVKFSSATAKQVKTQEDRCRM